MTSENEPSAESVPSLAARECYAPEHRALVCCARVHLDARTRDELLTLARAGLDYARLARDAAYHGLSPLLCRHAHSTLLGFYPAEALAQLTAATQASVVASLALASELVIVLEALRQSGVPALAIKGPVSAALCYGDLGLRTFADLDLLLDEAQVEQAKRVLEARGYAANLALSPAWHARLVRSESEELFRHADGRRLVDLHWVLLPRGYSFTPGKGGIYASRQCVRIGASEVPTLGTEATLLFLLLHGIKHQWGFLCWLCDVAELIGRHAALDWNAVLSASAAPGPRRFIDIGLALAHSLLQAPVPPEVLRRGERDPIVAKSVREIERQLFAHEHSTKRSLAERSLGLLYFRSMERTSDKLRFLHDVALRPTAHEWRALPLPQALAPLHYALRPARLLWKHTRLRSDPHE